MDTTDAPICGATYTTLGNRVFRCKARPHPRRPDEHYFVRDHSATPAPRRHRSLITIPGERS